MSPRFDARALVGPPYKSCPNCGTEEFGVYHIGGTSYSRRCKQCWHKGEFPLWPLSRKVIYIDQFAISNMMKALDTASKAHSRAAADPFWLTLFERLDRLVKLQLVICPHSDVHRRESMVTDYFEALKRMYEQLSHGISFDSLDVIGQRQLSVALTAWLNDETPNYNFDPEKVTSGRLNDWTGRIIISVSGEYPADIIEGIRTFRDRVHDGVRDVFTHYQSVQNTDFAYWLEHERTAGVRAILHSAQMYFERTAEIFNGIRPFTFDNIYSSTGYDHFQIIVEALKLRGVASHEIISRLVEFLQSDTYKNYPANQISSLLWAVIARNAALGQKAPPNTGMMNDISVVSTLLPYCDAMFIDNGFRGLWENIPRDHRVFQDKRLFSYNMRDEFLVYLDDIEAQADALILATVRDVYGEPEPFLTMYDVERRMRNHDT